MKRVLAVISTVAALLAVSVLASAEQPMFRPLDGSTWDVAQVREWLTKKSVKTGVSGVQEGAQSTAVSTGQVGADRTKKAGERPEGDLPVLYPPTGADR